MGKRYKFNLSKLEEKQRFQQYMGFLNIAYKDYLAARTLLNTGQLFRGAILANTCIEKYFKVFLTVKGNKCNTHDVFKLLKTIENFDRELNKNINHDFIKFICLAYNMRYFDNNIFNDPVNEFNMCIYKNKTLAELDYTVSLIENGWNIKQEGRLILTQYKSDILGDKDLLFKNNYILNKIDKTDFLEKQEEEILELRNDKQMGLIEIKYRTKTGRNDGKFVLEALRKTPKS